MMIDFDGMVLPPMDASAGQALVSLAVSTEGTGSTLGATLSVGAGDDVVLQDLSQDTGDEWILPLLTGASSGAIAAAMPGLSEIVLLDPQSTEGEQDVPDILITGPRHVARSYDWEGGGGGGSTGGGHSGSGGGGYAAPVEQHTQDCGTEDGAAVQVARHVKGELPPGVSGPVDPVTTSSGNDWKNVEFGAVIVRNSDGSFGALNNMIYSSDMSGFVVYPNIAGQAVQGLWHSHDQIGDDAGQLRLDRYPSATDWHSLSIIAAQPGAVSDPSLWLMDAFGVTREFKLSERNYFESMDDARKGDGEGLAGKERAQSCG